jgi:processive 1,2-diacylglycerol beta-glucosyltransferase
MNKKKILLMYISEDSGHHMASLAIEKALHLQDNNVETLNVNSFNYTNPVLEKIINKTYMSVIRRKPEVWGYLYDNPKIVKRTQRLRDAIHKHNAEKLKNLLTSFCPDAAACTQAFPCGMIADYKKTFNVELPLFGVLTDYAPHSYWIYDKVNTYFVPAKETGQRLINNGVSPNRVIETGIPVDPIFKTAKDRSKIYDKIQADNLINGRQPGGGPIKRNLFIASKN